MQPLSERIKAARARSRASLLKSASQGDSLLRLLTVFESEAQRVGIRVFRRATDMGCMSVLVKTYSSAEIVGMVTYALTHRDTCFEGEKEICVPTFYLNHQRITALMAGEQKKEKRKEERVRTEEAPAEAISEAFLNRLPPIFRHKVSQQLAKKEERADGERNGEND